MKVKLQEEAYIGIEAQVTVIKATKMQLRHVILQQRD